MAVDTLTAYVAPHQQVHLIAFTKDELDVLRRPTPTLSPMVLLCVHFTASWNPSSAVRHTSHCPGVIDREMRLGLRSQCRQHCQQSQTRKKEIYDAILYFATFRSFSTDQVVAADAGALLRIEG